MGDIKIYEPLWGAWYVDSLIGEGSFGQVYKVRREEFGKTYFAAVKILTIPQSESDIRQVRGEGMDDASLRSYFHTFVADIVQEIDLMSEFRGNSNIVSFEDHKVIEKKGSIGWDILIRMELLTSLTDYVTEKPLPREDVIKLGIHICRALEICAMKKTIHRDIKPDNIFVSQYGDYKLGDFGIARQIERTTSGLSKKGTYTYMAPEVFRGFEYGANVDIYSLGIMMYRFLNQNRTPFLPDYPNVITHRDRDAALQRRIEGEPLPDIKGIDPELNAIVLKACAYDRNARFSSPTEMRYALDSLISEKSFMPVATPVGSTAEIDRTAIVSAAESAAVSGPSPNASAPDRTAGLFADSAPPPVAGTGASNKTEYIGSAHVDNRWGHEEPGRYQQQQQPARPGGHEQQPAGTGGYAQQPAGTGGYAQQPARTDGYAQQPARTDGYAQQQPASSHGYSQKPVGSGGFQQQQASGSGGSPQQAAGYGGYAPPPISPTAYRKPESKPSSTTPKKTMLIASVAAACLLILIGFGIYTLNGGLCGGYSDTPPTDPYSGNVNPNPNDIPAGDDGQGNAPIPPTPPESINYAKRVSILQDYVAVNELGPLLPGGNATAAHWSYTMIYDTLLTIGEDNRIAPNLAANWETDGVNNYFNLRGDVYFHNGEHFTAEDVANTILLAKDSPLSAAHAIWSLVDSWLIISDYEILLTLADANADFLFFVTSPAAGIVNKRAIDADPDYGHLIGTGAFRVAEFVPSDHTLFTRNDDWWRIDAIPPTEEIFMQYIPESAVHPMALMNGDFDVSFGIFNEDMDMFEQSSDLMVSRYVTNSPPILNFNLNDPITGDYNFRMAVLHLLDRRYIAEISMGEWAIADISDGSLWGGETEFRNPNIPVIDYDPSLYGAYLDASVYNGETIEISCPPGTVFQTTAEIIQAKLHEAGFAAEITVLDWPAMLTSLEYGNNQSQISVLSTSFGENAGSIRDILYPGGSRNWSGFNNPEVTGLLDEAARTHDENRRRDIYFRIQEIVSEVQPAAALFWPVRGVVSNSNVSGMILRSDMQRTDLRWINMIVD